MLHVQILKRNTKMRIGFTNLRTQPPEMLMGAQMLLILDDAQEHNPMCGNLRGKLLRERAEVLVSPEISQILTAGQPCLGPIQIDIRRRCSAVEKSNRLATIFQYLHPDFGAIGLCGASSRAARTSFASLP